MKKGKLQESMDNHLYKTMYGYVVDSSFIILDDKDVIEGLYSSVYNRVKGGVSWEVRHFTSDDANPWCCYCGDDTHLAEECDSGLSYMHTEDLTRHLLSELKDNKNREVLLYENETGVVTSYSSEDFSHE